MAFPARNSTASWKAWRRRPALSSASLPPENATGNFTKIVQRVPVRVHLDDEDSQLGQLRPGLSVMAEVDTRSGTQGGDTRNDAANSGVTQSSGQFAQASTK